MFIKQSIIIFQIALCGLAMALCPKAAAVTFLDMPSQQLLVTDPLQMGRLTRQGIIQDWSGAENFPGVINSSTLYHYRTYTVPAATIRAARFIQIIVDSTSPATFVSAYAGAYLPDSAGAPNFGFDVNYLGDAGASGNFFGVDPSFFQVVVPPGQDLIVVVNDVPGVIPLVSSPFRLTVEGFIDTQYTEPPPDLTIAKTHSGNFKQGDAGDSYAITVSNTGQIPTIGTVTVVDTLPAGLTASSIGGNGWMQTGLAPPTAVRSDALAVGASYPPLTVTVNVAGNAPRSVTNVATVSGGGETNLANNSASDATTILPGVTFVSGPSYSPNPAIEDLTTTFTVAADPPNALVTWDFGDGSAFLTGTTVQHMYVAAGTYTVTVTAQNLATGSSATTQISVIVTQLAIGTSTFLPGTLPLTVTLGKINLYPSIVRIQGSMPLPVGTVLAGKAVSVSVNGFSKTFVLNKNGSAHTAQASFTIRNGPAGTAAFTLMIHSKIGLELSSKVGDDSLSRPKIVLFELQAGGLLGSYIAPLEYKNPRMPGLAVFGSK